MGTTYKEEGSEEEQRNTGHVNSDINLHFDVSKSGWEIVKGLPILQDCDGRNHTG